MTVTQPRKPDPTAPPDRPSSRLRWKRRVPDFLASYLAFVATFCAVTALLPVLRDPLSWLRQIIEVISVGAPPSLATAAFLGILATAVRRRMRVAWWILAVYVVVDRLLHLVVVIDTEAEQAFQVTIDISTWVRVLFGVIALALLLFARDQFTARMDKGNGWRALAVYVGLAVVGCTVGFALLQVFPGTLSSQWDRFGWAVSHVLVGLGTPDVAGIEGAAPRPITFLCGVFGALAVLAAARVLLRPRSFRRHLQPDDEQRLRGLLDRYGDQDSLGYFATRRDKSASSPTAARRRSPTASARASASPAATRSATWRPGRARSSAWLDEARTLRLGARRDGRQRGGRQGVRRRRPRRHRDRRRGDPRRRATSPSTDARCASSGRP